MWPNTIQHEDAMMSARLLVFLPTLMWFFAILRLIALPLLILWLTVRTRVLVWPAAVCFWIWGMFIREGRTDMLQHPRDSLLEWVHVCARKVWGCVCARLTWTGVLGSSAKLAVQQWKRRKSGWFHPRSRRLHLLRVRWKEDNLRSWYMRQYTQEPADREAELSKGGYPSTTHGRVFKRLCAVVV